MQSYTPLFTELSPTREERWERLASFAAFWHGVDCSAIDCSRSVLQAEARLGIKLPDALVEWHARFGRFVNLWSGGAFTIPIDRLCIDNHHLILRSEFVFEGRHEAKWGIPVVDIELEDPPVVSILGNRTHHCADSVSEFAVYCALFDTINAWHSRDIGCANDVPFPSDGKKANFPPSFGIIKTEVYEGVNWIALVSGRDWYLRRRNPESATDNFVKHEVRTEGPPTKSHANHQMLGSGGGQRILRVAAYCVLFTVAGLLASSNILMVIGEFLARIRVATLSNGIDEVLFIAWLGGGFVGAVFWPALWLWNTRSQADNDRCSCTLTRRHLAVAAVAGAVASFCSLSAYGQEVYLSWPDVLAGLIVSLVAMCLSKYPVYFVLPVAAAQLFIAAAFLKRWLS